MYITIGILVFIILSLFGIILVPMNKQVRRIAMAMLKTKSPYSDDYVYSVLKIIDDGFESHDDAMNYAMSWCLISIVTIAIASWLALLWPLTLCFLLICIMFHFSVKK
jgi:hypothetical protein